MIQVSSDKYFLISMNWLYVFQSECALEPIVLTINMENLNIEATERSPKIAFDYENHVLEISGEAYPENNDDFYRPIFNSLQEYI